MNIRWTCLWTTKNYFDENNIFKHTTASSTGKKILAVPKFDVTWVKREAIITIIDITATCGRLAKNWSCSATVSDKPEF